MTSRRTFFKWLGVGAASAAVLPSAAFVRVLEPANREWIRALGTNQTWTPAPDLLERVLLGNQEWFDVKAYLLDWDLNEIASVDVEITSKPDNGGGVLDTDDIQFEVGECGAAARYISLEAEDLPIAAIGFSDIVGPGTVTLQNAAEGILRLS